MKSISNLRDLDLSALEAELLSARQEQFRLRFKKSRGDLNQSHLLNAVKIKIAQIKTLITEKSGVKND